MISITIKLTNRCNMNCMHCYDYISHHLIADMPDAIIEQTILYIEDYAKKHSSETILVTFIGGEVMLVGEDKILYVMNRLEHICNIRFMLSTNLMYDITEKVIEIAQKAKNPCTGKSSIATSWDYKIRFQTIQQENRFFNNLDILSSNNIIVSVSVALTKYLVDDVDPDELFEKMHQHNVRYMIFEHLVDVGNAHNNKQIFALNRDVDNWMVRAYDAHAKYGINIEEFDEIEYAIANDSSIYLCKSLCNDIVVNTDGALSFLKNNTNITYGDVYGHFNEDIYLKNVHCDHRHCTECMICENYGKLCVGICRLNIFDESGCPGYKNLMKHIKQKLIEKKHI